MVETDPFGALGDYEVRHLVQHLANAGHDGDLHRLLRLEAGPDRTNAWFAERDGRDDVGGYLDDVVLARGLASAACIDAVARGLPAIALAQELRYVLVTASISSLSRNLPPALLAALVATNEWSSTQALRYAARQPFAPLRAEAFALVAEHCAGDEQRDCLRQAVDAARAISFRPDWRVRALGQISARAPADLRRDLVREGLALLREIGVVETDENTATLLDAAPEDLRDEVAALLTEVPATTTKPLRPGQEGLAGRPNPWTYGVRRFAALLPGLPAAAREAVVDAVRRDEGEEAEPVHKAVILASSAGTDPSLAVAALRIARSIPEPELGAEVAAAVAPYLDNATRAETLDRALADAGQATEDARALALIALAPALAAPARAMVLEQALAATRAVADGGVRSYLLRFLVPLLPAHRLDEVRAEIDRLPDGGRGRVIAALATLATRPEVIDLLRLTRRIGDVTRTLTVVAELAAPAPADLRHDLVSRMLDVVATGPPDGRVDQLAALVPLLDDAQFARVAATADGDEIWRVLAPHAVTEERLALVERGGDVRALVTALRTRAAAADASRPHLLRRVWDAVEGIDDLPVRLGLSATLLDADEVDPDGKARRVRRLCDAVRSADRPLQERIDALARLVPHLPADERPALVEDLLAGMREVMDEQRPWVEQATRRLRPLQYIPAEYVPHALRSLLPYVTPAQHSAVFAIIGGIREEFWRVGLLTDLAIRAPEVVEDGDAYFDVAHAFTNLREWAQVHCAALPLISDGQRRQRLVAYLLRQAERLTGDQIMMPAADLVAGLLPYLDPEQLPAVRAVAARSTDPWTRSHLAMLLAPYADDPVAAATGIDEPQHRSQALVGLAARHGTLRDQPDLAAALADLGGDPELLRIVDLLPEWQRLAVLDAATLDWLRGTTIRGPEPLVRQYMESATARTVHALVRDVTSGLTDHPRSTVLEQLITLNPALRRLAGDRVAADLADAVLDVVRWWP